MKKLLTVITSCFALLMAGCSASIDGYRQEVPDNEFISNIQKVFAPKNYKEILAEGAEPAIPPDYEFPKSYQYENGCFGYSVKHIVKYKYDEEIDMIEAEKKTRKPRYELWNTKHIKSFLKEYGYKITWYSDAETFFNFLTDGEPLIIQYKYPIAGDRWIGHYVAVYSFEDEGVWIAQSMTNKLEKVPYEEVFNSSGTHTRFVFAVVDKAPEG